MNEKKKVKLCQIVLKNCSDMIKCFKVTQKGKGFDFFEKV